MLFARAGGDNFDVKAATTANERTAALFASNLK